ncbi:F21D18.24 [Arabidopsis thaliana]|uniref:F21D18.24 n=1 Tax=Arabidopsis thaliana TaxID=3702 RepID=Q9LNF7_ARATH|nr:F21D18.24 [Arabidopsis thaliana]
MEYDFDTFLVFNIIFMSILQASTIYIVLLKFKDLYICIIFDSCFVIVLRITNDGELIYVPNTVFKSFDRKVLDKHSIVILRTKEGIYNYMLNIHMCINSCFVIINHKRNLETEKNGYSQSKTFKSLKTTTKYNDIIKKQNHKACIDESVITKIRRKSSKRITKTVESQRDWVNIESHVKVYLLQVHCVV